MLKKPKLNKQLSSHVSPSALLVEGQGHGQNMRSSGNERRALTGSNPIVQTLLSRVTIQQEVVTKLFESMLDNIVESWQVISMDNKDNQNLKQISFYTEDFSVSEKVKLKKAPKTDPISRSWWSEPGEKVVIKFKNGNIYHGDISLKYMNGEGRYQWTDGTVYTGQFRNNKIDGKGILFWKDDTWYQGDFSDNLRHGQGLYVDSRKQRAYFGGWYHGTKHGEGKMCYSEDNFDYYDGDWEENYRHGSGVREYCRQSGYRGDWDSNTRDGKGMMIWPNHDFYRGDWKHGVISGNGTYIWDITLNFSMSTPDIITYQGDWYMGKRHGYGLLNFGHRMGAYYKGGFKNNKKHGSGLLVTNNGLIFRNAHLFYDDSFTNYYNNHEIVSKTHTQNELYQVDLFNEQINLLYHIEYVYKHFDRQGVLRARIINEYIKNNESLDFQRIKVEELNPKIITGFFQHETNQLFKVVKFYEPKLKRIYYKYAKIFNQEEIRFTPVMIRLQLWQFYYDCNLHKKGLTLVDVDYLLYDNPDWLIAARHNPFESIYFWQFLHSLISVARKLYAIRELPGPKPETIMASAFQKFMKSDVLLNISCHKGNILNHCSYIPLQGLYKLYQDLGEPHTILTFLRAVRKTNIVDRPKPNVNEITIDELVVGHNTYMLANDMAYIIEGFSVCEQKEKKLRLKANESSQDMKLFKFANLSNACILRIFANIFTGFTSSGNLFNLEIKMTFFEFFEAFITCAFMSLKTEEEERIYQKRWRAFKDQLQKGSSK